MYEKFRWLISHVQLSFQPLLVNVLIRRTNSRGDTVVPEAEVHPIWIRYVIVDPPNVQGGYLSTSDSDCGNTLISWAMMRK